MMNTDWTIVAAAAALLTLAFVVMGRTLLVRWRRSSRTMRARAVVISVSEAGANGRDSNGRYTSAAVDLEVRPTDGEPYRATVYWKIYAGGLVAIVPRAEIDVLVDTSRPGNVYPSVDGVQRHGILARLTRRHR